MHLKLIFFFLFFLTSTVNSGIPVWSLTPIGKTDITLTKSNTATVKYKVTNNSKKPHTLVMEPINGVKQNVVSNSCGNPIKLTDKKSCTSSLIFWEIKYLLE